MNEIEFLSKSDELLIWLVDVIEKQDVDSKIDIELQDRILTLETNLGIFVINRQVSAQEIWLSSPISGPYHFNYKSDCLVNKEGISLLDLLCKELNIKLANHNV